MRFADRWPEQFVLAGIGGLLVSAALAEVGGVDMKNAENRYAVAEARQADFEIRYDDIAAEIENHSSPEAIDIVFVGDSLTELWLYDENPWIEDVFCGGELWNEYFADPTSPTYALNLGVAGDRTEHVLHRLASRTDGGLGQLDDTRIQPAYIFLMIGINNTWARDDPGAAAIDAGIQAVATRLHALRPQAKILVSSLLPTNEVKRNASFVVPVNRQLEKYYGGGGGTFEYVDLYSLYVDADGRQIDADFYDGVHLNRDGYRKWAAHLLELTGNAP